MSPLRRISPGKSRRSAGGLHLPLHQLRNFRKKLALRTRSWIDQLVTYITPYASDFRFENQSFIKWMDGAKSKPAPTP